MIDTALRALLSITLTFPLGAQEPEQFSMPDGYKAVQVRQLEAQHRLLLAMADSMPTRLYRDRATPEQRDFANQLYHAANGVVQFARLALNKPVPIAPDTAVVFNQPEAMKAYLERVYTFAIEELVAQSGEERNVIVDGPGRRMPRWQLWDEIHQHTLWTAGQIVANFRKHGMAPPGWGFF